jgi:hypothetical protein
MLARSGHGLEGSTQRGCVSKSPMPEAHSLQSAKSAHTRKARAGRKRGRLTKMCFGVVAVGGLIAAVAMVAMVFIPAPTSIAENAASRVDPNSVGTIILRSSTSDCHQKSFNNQTGQIFDQPSSCHNDVALDANGVPIPSGTIHTLNSISKSFQR